MGEYAVKGTVPFPIYQFGADEEVDFTGKPYTKIEYPYDDFPIPATDKYTLWSGSGGYLKIFGYNNNNNTWNMDRSTITGSNPAYTDTVISRYNFYEGAGVFIWAFTLPNGDFRVQVYPRWEADGYEGALRQINSDPRFNGNALYIGTWDPESSIVEYVEDWDESPSDDPGNPQGTLPMGGEFADTDPFGKGNTDIDVADTVTEMDYSGLLSAYQLDNGELFTLGDAVFSSSTWSNMRLKFDGIGDPISYIVSAVEIPYNARGNGKPFKLGGVTVENSNGPISISSLDQRYHLLQFGSINLKETWGTEKDYSTTDISIFLPYVGVKDLDTSMVMNATITLKAFLDAWNGDLLYLLVVDNKNASYKYIGSHGICYRFQGNCGKSIPIGKVDNSGQLMAQTGAMASMGVGLMTGNPMMAIGGAVGMIGAAAVPPKVSMTGGISGSIGRADVQEAYLIIRQSVPKYPNGWRAEIGAPRYQMFNVSDMHGYTKFSEFHADDIEGASDQEKAMIEQAMKAGVFLP